MNLKQQKLRLMKAGVSIARKSDEEIQLLHGAMFSNPEPEPEPEPAAGGIEGMIQDIVRTAMSRYADVDESAVIALIEKHAAKTTYLKVERPDASTVTFEHSHPRLPFVVQCLQAGLNVYLHGPSGTGKSHMTEQAAQALGTPMATQSALVSLAQLTGYMSATGEYVTSVFRDAFENGKLYVLEEMDGSIAKALLAFNEASANRRFTFPDGANVRAHPDFRVIACANTVGNGATRQYVGRSQLDGATLNRFIKILIGYDSELELAVAKNAHAQAGGSDFSAVARWVLEVQGFRQKLDANKLSILVTPRQSAQGAALLAVDPDLDMELLRECTLYSDLTQDQRRSLAV